MRKVAIPEQSIERLKRNVLSGIGVMILGKSVIGGLGFVTKIVLARLLEPAGLGIFGILTNAVSLCVVVTNVGTQNSHIHDLGKELSTPGSDVGFSILYSLSAGILGILGFYLIYDLWLYDLYFVRYFEEQYPPVIKIFLVIPASILWLHLYSILLGDKRFRMSNVFFLLNSALFLVGLITYDLIFRTPLHVAVAAWISSTVLSVVLLLLYCVTKFRSTLSLKFSGLRHKVKYGSQAMASGLSVTLAQLAPVFIVGYFLGSEEVGVFFLAFSLARIVEQMGVVLNSVLFPYNSSLDITQAIRLTDDSFRLFLYASLVGLILCVPISTYGIPLAFGAAYGDSSILLIAMMPGVVALSLMRILHVFFLGQSRPRTPIVPYVATLMSIVFLEIMLIPRLGSLGAAIGLTGAYWVGLGIIIRQYISFTGASFSHLYRCHGPTFKS